MNLVIKIAIYLVLIIAAIFFSKRFYSLYRPAPAASQVDVSEAEPKKQSDRAAEKSRAETNPTQVAVSVTSTNASLTNPPVVAPVVTNAAALTNQSALTNLATNAVAATNASASNAVATSTGNRPSTPATNESSAIYTAGGYKYSKTPVKNSMAKTVGYFGALVAVLIVLGVMLARDVTNLLGSQTVEFLFNDEGEGFKSPEYEEAEAVWANGEPLEAIQLMREYLKKNPREQYVALRIAEIYEKDLKNELAAALEYEEILKKKLPPERWGWAAIHLCNIYSRNGRTDEAIGLLQRIISEHPKIAAATKARKRLAMYESGDPNALAADDTSNAPELSTAAETPAAPAETGMPPGFRPKS